MRQTLRDSAKLAADSLDGNLENRHRQRSEHKCDDRAGHAPLPFSRPKFDDRERDSRQPQRRPLKCAGMLEEHLQLIHKLSRDLLNAQTEEIFDLRAENEHGDSRGEAHRNRIGNEFDHRAQPRHPHDQ